MTGLKPSASTAWPIACGDLAAVLDQLGEVAIFQILVELPLAQLVLAARLGHEGQMGVDRPRIAEGFQHEHLPRRVRQVLLGANHVRDLQLVIVDHVGQVIKARAVGALHDVILLAGPIELDPAAHHVVQDERPLLRHLQPHDRLTAFASNRARSAGVSAMKRRL